MPISAEKHSRAFCGARKGPTAEVYRLAIVRDPSTIILNPFTRCAPTRTYMAFVITTILLSTTKTASRCSVHIISTMVGTSKKYLRAAPRQECWEDKAEALLQSLGSDGKKREKYIRQTLDNLRDIQ